MTTNETSESVMAEAELPGVEATTAADNAVTVSNDDAAQGMTSDSDNATDNVKPVELAELNGIGKVVLEETVSDLTEAAKLHKQVQSVRNEAVLISEERENNSDPEVVAFREWLAGIDEQREQAITNIDAYIRQNLVPVTAPEDVAAAELKLTTLKDKIKAGVAYASKSNPDFEAHLPESFTTVIKSGRGGGAKSGQGMGGKKPRITGVYLNDVIADHEVKDDDGTVSGRKSTFTDAVREIQKATGARIPTTDLHKAYFDTAGSEDMDKIADDVTFRFEAGEGDKRMNYLVRVTK